jgi:aspartyl-tRNA(Asn)/glutamyl-tRNA(Gln) amidotransferase subunit A
MNAQSLAEIAAAVRRGRRSARSYAEEAIASIRTRDGAINAVTRLLEARALADAARVDAQVAAGVDPGPLAGAPFGVKDLFDVAGLPNTAGAGMLRDAAPAAADAAALSKLAGAGAVLVATLNMDEFAYGFATINAFHGTTRNPHDTDRLCGGSSGGSAAAVAGGMLPFTLGSDTNGSIRVPAALCGLYGLKPSHGGLSMAGVAPFVDTLDDIGPFARSVEDLRLVYRVLGGAIGSVPASLRVAQLGGWFARNVVPELRGGIAGLSHHFGSTDVVELAEVSRARSAAFLITAAEAGARHLPALRDRALEFDPATRDRLIAGAMLPASAYFSAMAFRDRFGARMAELFERYDVLVAPAAGVVAPRVGDPSITVDGLCVPARAHLGLFTQPISLVGLPVLSAPLLRPGGLPLGVQLIASWGNEAVLFAAAEALEGAGLVGACAPARTPG